MNLMPTLPWFLQGLTGGVVTLVVLAVRSALEGRSGVTFADLWTALGVGIAVALVPLVLAWLVQWRMRGMGMSQEFLFLTPSDRRGAPEPPARGGSDTVALDRFDHFTDPARKVLTLAQDEAQRLNHNYIGTEHLLLGLVREGEGVAAQVLGNLGVELPKVRTAVEFIIGRGDRPVVGEVGLTPRAKRVIELAIDESRALEHNHIGTEHLLLGLIREGEGIGAGVLASLGVSLERTRHEVVRVTQGGDDPG